jgi:hypothetical protein
VPRFQLLIFVLLAVAMVVNAIRKARQAKRQQDAEQAPPGEVRTRQPAPRAGPRMIRGAPRPRGPYARR